MSDLISRQAAIDALKRDEEYDEDIPNRADGVRDAIITIMGLPSVQSDNDMVHLQKEQAYMQGWEEGRKALRKEMWEDGRDRLN